MRGNLRRFKAALLLVLSAGLALTSLAQAESDGGLRVMPLGDSITDGFNVPGGYRIKLVAAAGGRRVRVGLRRVRVQRPGRTRRPRHEGHSGWRIDHLDANIVGWLQNSNPRTILLHIGTNDVNQNYDIANAPVRLSALIDKIRTHAPLVELFVAQITPESFRR